LKEPLTAFMDYLEQMNVLMNEEKERYSSVEQQVNISGPF
jgi:hypothetical protein